MKRLVLDLGTTTGFAVGGREHMVSGSWSLKPSRFESVGMVYVKFRQKLNEIHKAYGVEQVAYEEVRNHKGVDASHRYGGLLGALQAWCIDNGIEYQGVGVGTIKKSFTGSGNANKDRMIAECVRRGFNPVDDNEADAIAAFDYMLKRDEDAAADAPMTLDEMAA